MSTDYVKRDPFDIFITCLAVLEAAGLAVFPVIGSVFGQMYGDFGGEIPLVTRLALSVWLPLVAAVAVVVAVAGAWILGKPSASRGALVVALVAGFLGNGFLWFALYLPIYELAGKIREGSVRPSPFPLLAGASSAHRVAAASPGARRSPRPAP